MLADGKTLEAVTRFFMAVILNDKPSIILLMLFYAFNRLSHILKAYALFQDRQHVSYNVSTTRGRCTGFDHLGICSFGTVGHSLPAKEDVV